MPQVRLSPSGPFISFAVKADELFTAPADVSPAAGPAFTTVFSTGPIRLKRGAIVLASSVVAWRGATGDRIVLRAALLTSPGGVVAGTLGQWTSPAVPAALNALDQQATLQGRFKVLSAGLYELHLQALSLAGAPKILGTVPGAQETTLQVQILI